MKSLYFGRRNIVEYEFCPRGIREELFQFYSPVASASCSTSTFFASVVRFCQAQLLPNVSTVMETELPGKGGIPLLFFYGKISVWRLKVTF